MSRRETKDTCYVYLIGDCREAAERLVKVGISHSPATRLASISTSCPFQVDLLRWWRFPSKLDAYQIEQKFHESMAQHRRNGEWFAMSWTNAADFLDDYCLDFWISNDHFARLLDNLKFAGYEEEDAIGAIDSRYCLKSMDEEFEDWKLREAAKEGK